MIINDKFLTSDPSIYAAGPTTKYDHKYFAERFEQEYFCQAEIGRALGKSTILKKNPNFSKNLLKEKGTSTVQRFKESIISNCVLPGGYNYLNVQVPGFQKITESFKNGIFISTGGEDKLSATTDIEVAADHERKKSIFSKSAFWKFASESISINQSSSTLNKSLGNFSTEYFKIHVNEYHVVDNIVCFTKKVFMGIRCSVSGNN